MNDTFTLGHPEPEQVMAWADGESVSADVERHLAECHHCQAVAADFRIVGGHLAAWTIEPATFALPRISTSPQIKWRYVAMAALLVIVVVAWSSIHEWTGSPAPAHGVIARPALEDRAAEDRGAFERDWAARSRVDVGVPADGASVVVVVFVDWQCPTCAHLEYAPVIAAYDAAKPGAVRYVIKDYPLNSRCNANIPVQVPPHHPAACEAAAAVRMARDRGKADEFIDWVFANQRDLTPERVKAEATSMLGVKDFDAEYARKLHDVQRDVTDAAPLHLQFTPSVFVNGVPANRAGGEPPSTQQLDWAIQYELTRAGR